VAGRAAAVAVEQAGLKVDFGQKDALVYPAELAARILAGKGMNDR